MCDKKNTVYYHVLDDETGEHIATYTDREAADARHAHEAIDNGRDGAYVTTDPLIHPDDLPDIYDNGRYYKPGQLISLTDVKDAA